MITPRHEHLIAIEKVLGHPFDPRKIGPVSTGKTAYVRQLQNIIWSACQLAGLGITVGSVRLMDGSKGLVLNAPGFVDAGIRKDYLIITGEAFMEDAVTIAADAVEISLRNGSILSLPVDRTQPFRLCAMMSISQYGLSDDAKACGEWQFDLHRVDYEDDVRTAPFVPMPPAGQALQGRPLMADGVERLGLQRPALNGTFILLANILSRSQMHDIEKTLTSERQIREIIYRREKDEVGPYWRLFPYSFTLPNRDTPIWVDGLIVENMCGKQGVINRQRTRRNLFGTNIPLLTDPLLPINHCRLPYQMARDFNYRAQRKKIPHRLEIGSFVHCAKFPSMEGAVWIVAGWEDAGVVLPAIPVELMNADCDGDPLRVGVLDPHTTVCDVGRLWASVVFGDVKADIPQNFASGECPDFSTVNLLDAHAKQIFSKGTVPVGTADIRWIAAEVPELQRMELAAVKINKTRARKVLGEKFIPVGSRNYFAQDPSHLDILQRAAAEQQALGRDYADWLLVDGGIEDDGVRCFAHRAALWIVETMVSKQDNIDPDGGLDPVQRMIAILDRAATDDPYQVCAETLGTDTPDGKPMCDLFVRYKHEWLATLVYLHEKQIVFSTLKSTIPTEHALHLSRSVRGKAPAVLRALRDYGIDGYTR